MAGRRKPHYSAGGIDLYLGDCLEILPELELGSVDAIVTDPPYSSGGAFRADRMQTTTMKYVHTSSVRTYRQDFAGDNRDQRGYLAWCSLWLGACYRASRRGAVLYCFADWRQVPILSDAIQCGGWIWRNLATWWKPGVRMQRGRLSLSAEYVLCASAGVPEAGECSPQNVIAAAPVLGERKQHIAEKPLAVLSWLISTTIPRALILDPFIGCGTTAVACFNSGRRCIGIDLDPNCISRAAERMEMARRRGPDGVLFRTQSGGGNGQAQMAFTEAVD